MAEYETDLRGPEEALPAFLPPLLEEQYGPALTERILAGYRCQRAVTLRANTLKTDRAAVEAALTDAGLAPEQLPWYPDAFLLPRAREDAVRALPMYKAGEVYLQSLSSMLPPLALNPQPGMDILDMAAAPGGKTTQLAALAGNRCHITACELNPRRGERLKYNVAKQGASCVYVMVTDARQLSDSFAFDSVLLDAPCSGSGTLSLTEPGPGRFTQALVEKSVRSQKALLAKGLRLLKTGGELVYSTCSVLAAENEDVVAWALESAGVELVPIRGDWLEALPLLPTRLAGTVCVCPDSRFEGFFVAKLRKTGPVRLPGIPGGGKGRAAARRRRR
ncbi:MAG: RsmB/NOP family class I SAM-dependent RNA methyltransferase [Clostridiales bacterium]|nr:RsmB/NOP family class I SAM-dependent RNA methyltransferase [Clostridiales bacterium]